MTEREFLTKVVKGEVGEKEVEYAGERIKKLDATNKKRLEKKNAEQKAVDEKVLACVTADLEKAKVILEKVNASLGEDEGEYSMSKVVASLKRLIAENKVKSEKKDEGSRNVYLYALVA